MGMGLSCDGRRKLGTQPWSTSDMEINVFPFLSPKPKWYGDAGGSATEDG